MRAGYSGTPLVKKLGVKPGARIALVAAPHAFADVLGPLPDGTTIVSDGSAGLDFVLLFARAASELPTAFAEAAGRLTRAGMLWVAWPKKAAKPAATVPTDFDFAVVQGVGLAAGLVDTKICAIDEVWSGLRFVRRVSDRR